MLPAGQRFKQCMYMCLFVCVRLSGSHVAEMLQPIVCLGLAEFPFNVLSSGYIIKELNSLVFV